MFQISEATAIALHSVVYISSKEMASLKDISNRFDVSSNHLSKVLQKLVKCGYLISIKGPTGGFKIADGKEHTSFLEIYEAIEGKNWKKSCIFSSKQGRYCNDCIMGNLINEVNEKFENYMKEKKISNHNLLSEDIKYNNL